MRNAFPHPTSWQTNRAGPLGFLRMLFLRVPMGPAAGAGIGLLLAETTPSIGAMGRYGGGTCVSEDVVAPSEARMKYGSLEVGAAPFGRLTPTGCAEPVHGMEGMPWSRCGRSWSRCEMEGRAASMLMPGMTMKSCLRPNEGSSVGRMMVLEVGMG